MEEQVSLEKLKETRFQTILDIHKSRDWWERQPFEILTWLKTVILEPETILDVGCGDGRWVPAILDVYPKVKYTGIDVIKKHIDDCKKRWPEQEFLHRDFLSSEFSDYNDPTFLWCGKFNLMIFGGVFNPRMDKDTQRNILDEAQRQRPLYILITFDYASSGYPPWDFMNYYTEIDSFTISEKNQDRNQIVMAHLYRETEFLKYNLH